MFISGNRVKYILGNHQFSLWTKYLIEFTLKESPQISPHKKKKKKSQQQRNGQITGPAQVRFSGQITQSAAVIVQLILSCIKFMTKSLQIPLIPQSVPNGSDSSTKISMERGCRTQRCPSLCFASRKKWHVQELHFKHSVLLFPRLCAHHL